MARYTSKDVNHMAYLVGMGVHGALKDSDQSIAARDYIVNKLVKNHGSNGYGTRYTVSFKQNVFLGGRGARVVIAWLYGMALESGGMDYLGTTTQADEIGELINATTGKRSYELSEDEFNEYVMRGRENMRDWLKRN